MNFTFLLVNNPQQNRRIGSVNDIDPANGVYGSIDQNNAQTVYQQQQHQQQNQTRQSQQYAGHHQQQPSHKSKLVRYAFLTNLFISYLCDVFTHDKFASFQPKP